jgi:polygalacturonase
MTTARLPIPGSDDDTWGEILNTFLSVSLNSDGTLQTTAISQAGGVTSSTTASGDVSGTYSNLSVTKIHGISVSGTPSAGQALVASNTTSAAWATVPGTTDWVNVKAYGATGGGVTSDSAAIQSAITAAGSGVVYFPAGTYLLNTPLSITTACTFQGAGREATILQLGAGVNDYAIKFTQTSGEINAAHFLDFQIDGNAANQSTGGGGISAAGAVQCSFERLITDSSTAYLTRRTRQETVEASSSLHAMKTSTTAATLSFWVAQLHRQVQVITPSVSLTKPGYNR